MAILPAFDFQSKLFKLMLGNDASFADLALGTIPETHHAALMGAAWLAI
jgi:hypothetical protein